MSDPVIGRVLYQNDKYKVEIGWSWITYSEPKQYECYLVKNLDTEVVENIHNILSMAMDAADGLRDALLKREKPKTQAEPQLTMFN